MCVLNLEDPPGAQSDTHWPLFGKTLKAVIILSGGEHECHKTMKDLFERTVRCWHVASPWLAWRMGPPLNRWILFLCESGVWERGDKCMVSKALYLKNTSSCKIKNNSWAVSKSSLYATKQKMWISTDMTTELILLPYKKLYWGRG